VFTFPLHQNVTFNATIATVNRLCKRSRPGVTSSVLAPFQAVEYLKVLSEKIDNLSVIGIAGPATRLPTEGNA